MSLHNPVGLNGTAAEPHTEPPLWHSSGGTEETGDQFLSEGF